MIYKVFVSFYRAGFLAGVMVFPIRDSVAQEMQGSKAPGLIVTASHETKLIPQSVDWKLEHGLDDAATLLPSKLKLILEEKDFSGNQFREVLSKEEQKLVEPLMGTRNYFGQATQTRSDDLLYVAEMTEQQEEAALKEAVKKAKSHARVLALAAGLQLGKIRSLQSHAHLPGVANTAFSPVASYAIETAATGNTKSDREVTNVNPNALRRTLSVTIDFDLE